MPITMHSASVPMFVRMLTNLSRFIEKAEAHAQAKKFVPVVYVSNFLQRTRLVSWRTSAASSASGSSVIR